MLRVPALLIQDASDRDGLGRRHALKDPSALSLIPVRPSSRHLHFKLMCYLQSTRSVRRGQQRALAAAPLQQRLYPRAAVPSPLPPPEHSNTLASISPDSTLGATRTDRARRALRILRSRSTMVRYKC